MNGKTTEIVNVLQSIWIGCHLAKRKQIKETIRMTDTHM